MADMILRFICRNNALSDINDYFDILLAIFCERIEGKVLFPGVYLQ